MKHRAARKFWEYFRRLPVEAQRLADKNYELLKADPAHPSLHFKRVGRYWSVRIGKQYRALAVESNQDLVWFWIGTHAEYDAIIRRK